MTVRAGAVLVALLMLGCALPRQREVPPGPWHEVRTRHFVLRSDSPAETLLELARDLDRFVRVLDRFTNAEDFEPVLPSRIYLTADPEDFLRVRGGSHVVGQAISTLDGNFLVLPLTARSTSRATLYHEFVHFLLHNDLDVHYPTWYHEGLAEWLATMHSEGGVITLGTLPGRGIRRFEDDDWIPMERLFSDPISALASIEEVNLYYAQSWAFVNFVRVDGEQGGERTGQTARYLALLGVGEESGAAMRDAYGEDLGSLEADFRAHWDDLRQGRQLMLSLRADAFTPADDLSVEPVPTSEIVLDFAAMALLVRSEGDSLRWVEDWLLSVPPGSDDAAAARAMLAHWKAQRRDGADAMRAMDEALAIADPADARVPLAQGRLLVRLATEGDEPDADMLTRARAAFRRSAELEPSWPAPRFELGRTYVEEPSRDDVAEGVEALRSARAIHRASTEVELALGVLLVRAGELDAARPHLRRARTWAPAGSDPALEAAALLARIEESKVP